MLSQKLGRYLTLEEFCTCTQTYRKYADQIDPYPQNREETIPTLKALCEHIIDPVIDAFGRERFERLFRDVEIHCLTGDREFVGRQWCSYLMLPDVLAFRLRLRHSDRISSRSGKRRQRGARVFANLKVGEHRALSGKRWVWGCRVYVVATRLEDGELLILATNCRPQSAVTDYRLRWGIETLFAALKTRGFNLESTHFCHAERLSKLVALLALAFCWAMLTGLWQQQQQPIPLKAHGRRAKSLFRYGCDFLRRTFCDLSLQRAEFNQALQLLSLY